MYFVRVCVWIVKQRSCMSSIPINCMITRVSSYIYSSPVDMCKHMNRGGWYMVVVVYDDYMYYFGWGQMVIDSTGEARSFDSSRMRGSRRYHDPNLPLSFVVCVPSSSPLSIIALITRIIIALYSACVWVYCDVLVHECEREEAVSLMVQSFIVHAHHNHYTSHY